MMEMLVLLMDVMRKRVVLIKELTVMIMITAQKIAAML